MRIEIKNPLRIVDDVFIQRSEKSLSLFVNTKQRGIRPDAYGSGDDYFELYYYADIAEKPFEELKFDHVKIVADNDEEKMFLSCLHFELMSKNQLWIIFLPEEIYK